MVMTTTTPRTARRRQGVLPKSWVIAQISQRFFNFPKFGGYCSDFPLSTLHCFILIHSLPYLWGFCWGVLVPVIIIIVPFELTILGLTLGFDSSISEPQTAHPGHTVGYISHWGIMKYPMTYPIYFQDPDKMLGFAPHVFVKNTACSLYRTGLPNFQG